MVCIKLTSYYDVSDDGFPHNDNLLYHYDVDEECLYQDDVLFDAGDDDNLDTDDDILHHNDVDVDELHQDGVLV